MTILFNFLLCLHSLLLLCACHNQPQAQVEERDDLTTIFAGQAMTMQYRVIVGARLSTPSIEKISRLMADTFSEVDRVYNKWNPHSELSRLNSLKGGLKTPLSPALARLLQETDRIVQLSGGRFDPTIEPLQQLWKQKLQEGILPNAAELAAVAPTIGWQKIHFDADSFYKDHDNIQLDLGGIAKGLCIDLLVERLNAAGYPNLYVEWGGEIRASGRHPENRPWTVFISRMGDSDPKQALATLYLQDQAIATSGDYQQNWSLRLENSDGSRKTTTFFHIYDPQTLRPLETTRTSIASASVVAKTCVFADGLATTAMLFPSLAAAEQWLEQVKDSYPEISCWLISREQAAKAP